MKNVKAFTFAATSLAAALTNAQALAKSLDDMSADASKKESAMLDKALHSGCDQPANRDYHALLETFEAGEDDGFKFIGCGNAI